MAKFKIYIIILVSLLFLSVDVLNAYNLMGMKWPDGTIVRYNINENTSDVMTERGAVTGAMGSWSDLNTSGLKLVYNGSTGVTSSGFDGQNNIYWQTATQNGTLATATTWYSGSTTFETDINFNDAYDWFTNGGTFDIETVALHELGHCVGLGHDSGIMAPNYSGIRRSIDTDSRNGFYEMYGEPSGPDPSDPNPDISIVSPVNNEHVNGIHKITTSVTHISDISNVKFYINNQIIGEDTNDHYQYNWDTTNHSDNQYTLKVIVTSKTNHSNEDSIKVIVDNIHTLKIVTDPDVGGTLMANPQKSEYDHGDKVVLTASPIGEYVFIGWIGDISGTKNPYNLTMDEDKSITAKFNLPPTVTITNPNNNDVAWGIISFTANASDSDGIDSVKFYIDAKLIKTDTIKPYSCSWNTDSVNYGYHNLKVIAKDKIGLTKGNSIRVMVSTIKIDFNASLNSITSWLITRLYGQLNISIQNEDNIPVSKYIIYRSENGSDYVGINEFYESDLNNRNYSFQDKFLTEGSSYSYYIVAVDNNNSVIGSSQYKTIE